MKVNEIKINEIKIKHIEERNIYLEVEKNKIKKQNRSIKQKII